MPLIPYLIAFFAVSSYALLGPIAKKIGPNLPPFSFIALSTFMLCVPAAIIGFLYEKDKIIDAVHTIHWSWLVAFSMINLVAYVGYLIAINPWGKQ